MNAFKVAVKNLDNLIYLLMLLPFVQPFLSFGTDTSPLFMFFILLRLWITYKEIRIQRREIYLIIYSIGLAVLLSINGLSIGKSVSIVLVGFLIIYLNNSTINQKTIIISCIVYAFMLIFWIIKKDYALLFQSYFVRNINGGLEVLGTRGYPVLATEPGFFGAVIIMIAEIFRRRVSNIKNKNLWLTLILLMSLFSLSGTSVIYLFVYIGVTSWKPQTFLYFMGAIFVFLLTPLLIFETENRLTKFLSIIMTLDFDTLFLDSSFVYRITGLLTGIIMLFKNPFPNGENVRTIGNQYFDQYLSEYFINNDGVHWISSIGNLFSYGGIFSLVWIVILFSCIPRSRNIIYLIMTISFSFSLIFPLGYLLAFKKPNT